MFERLLDLVPSAFTETVLMAFLSCFFAFIFGLPLGLLLFLTSEGSLKENLYIYYVLGAITDGLRAIPFIILAALMTPITRFLLGQAYGFKAAIFILSISAIPFYGRICEMAFRSIHPSLIEAIHAMGASSYQIAREVLLPEAKSALITGLTVTTISILTATSMAGYIGAGGLGDLAIRYGYQRYDLGIMLSIIAILILLNILIQGIGNYFSQKTNK